MATFLELVNDVERESGTVSIQQRTVDVTAPATGRHEKIIQHVNEAWRLIQNSRDFWSWRQADFEEPLVASQARYPLAFVTAANASRFLRHSEGYSPVSLFDPAIGKSDEGELMYLPYRQWKTHYDRGAPEDNRPNAYAIDNQGQLCVGPIPDKVYTIRGEYIQTVQVLAINDDVPICPPDFQQVIVWRALMLLHGHDEYQFSLSDAQTKFSVSFRDLVNAEPEETIA